MKLHSLARLAPPLLGLAITFSALGAAHASSLDTPYGITHSAAVELVGAPCSVQPNVLENNQLIRVFPERLSYALPGDVTVTGPNGQPTVLAKGTLVDSYYVHADWANGGKNAPKTFQGTLSFAQPMLGIITNAPDLVATHPILGDPATSYPSIADQALESYDDHISFSDDGQTVNMAFTVWNQADQVRVITRANPNISTSGAAEMIGAPCSVVESTFENDQHIRVFPERLDYTLPSDITVNSQGAPNTVIPAGTKVNVYYVHADRIGNQPNVVKKLAGAVTFDNKVVAVLTSGSALKATHAMLGATQGNLVTAYSQRDDQGLDYGDKVTVNAQQNKVSFAFDVWDQTDQVRIITLAQ